MGAAGISLTLQPLDGARTTPIHELQPLVWSALADFAWRYTNSYESVWNEYLYRAESDPDDQWFSSDESSMTFWFPDFAGACSRSSGVGLHWFRAALAANYQAIAALTQEHGWLPSSNRPSLEEEVWDNRSHGWIEIDGELWEFGCNPDWNTDGLYGDDSYIALDDLSDENRALVDAAIEKQQCTCNLCVMLRPDPPFAQNMVESLSDDNVDVARTAVWYLKQTARLPLDIVSAVVERAHPSTSARDHASDCFEFGPKLEPTDAEALLDAFQEVNDTVSKAGYLGVVAGIVLDDHPALNERRLFTFVRALSEGEPLRDIAAEFSGYGGVSRGHEDHFARGLIGQIGASDEFDHNVALTLFNSYMREPNVPLFVVEALEELSRHESESVSGIATFAFQQLSQR